LALRFAILIPAHDERSAIEMKIASTHRLRLPTARGKHLAIVIDDGSTDGTADLARSAIAALPRRHDVEWRVVTNRHGKGKGAALLTGFEEARGCDLVAMTDADAVVEADAPIATERAFAQPRVGVATGTQRYVARISPEGDPKGDRGDLYDLLSEGVRRLESRAGALFSVHGPWLVVRATTGVRPVAGVGADDLDLNLQARARGLRSVLVPDAVYFEPKPDGRALASQRRRRARAYFEVVDRHLRHARRIAPAPFGGMQFLAYAVAPPLLAIAWLAALATPVARCVALGKDANVTVAAALATAGLALLRPFSTATVYAAVILLARLSPPRGPRADRWLPVARAANGVDGATDSADGEDEVMRETAREGRSKPVAP